MARAAILLGLVLPAALAPRADPGLVGARLEWEPGLLGEADSAKAPLLDAPPPGVAAPAADAPLRFALVPLGEGRPVAVAVDPRAGSPRIWVDRDLDGDLSRESPSALPARTRWFQRRLTLLVRFADEPVAVPVDVRFSVAKEKGADLWWDARIHRRGAVALGGMVRRAALRDASHTLRFGEGGKPGLLLDLNGDGVLEEAEGSPEWLAPGVPFRLLDEGWTFRVPSPSGGAVEFARAATAPPAAPRPWKPVPPPSRGAVPGKPAEPRADLLRKCRALPKEPEYATITGLLREVRSHGTEEAFAFLKTVADGATTAEVRGYAVWFMSHPAFMEKHGDEVAAYARSPVSQVARNTVYALYELGHPRLEKVCTDLLPSPDPWVAAMAAEYLGYLGTEGARRSVPPLVRGHRSPDVRRAAYRGCRAFPGGPPPEVMVVAARDADTALRVQALEDLFAVGHPEARALALEAAAHLGKAPAPADDGREGHVRSVLAVLGTFPDAECAGAALDLAAASPEGWRGTAVERLAALRAPAALAALVERLRAKEEARRELAARVLGRIPEGPVGVEVARQLRREKSEAVAVALVEALVVHGDSDAADVLLAAARGSGPVREAAVRSLAQLGLSIPEVRKFLLGLLDSRSWEDRAPVVDAVAASGDPSHLPRILPSLDHPAWQLRLAVVDALRRLRVREGVPPLVARLAVEETLRVRAAAAQALFELTGANFYDDAALWRRWLVENGASFRVPEEVPRLPGGDQGGTVGAFFGLPMDTGRVVFVLDRSGSMDAWDAERREGEAEPPTRFDRAVRETLLAVGRLAPGAKANVVLFDDGVHPWQEGLVPAVPAARAALEKHLRGMEPRGGTNLYDALEKALLERDADTVMVLTDGAPNSGKYTVPEDVLAGVRRLNRTRRIAVHCVSLGTDSDLLRRLAAENGGRYVRR